MTYAGKNSGTSKYKQSFAAEIGKGRSLFYTIFSGFFYTSLIIVSFIMLLWFCRQMSDHTKFVIRHIEFNNPLAHIDADILKRISLPFMQQNFFTANIFALKKRISQLPWVYAVTILRQWPNGLSIHIKEQEAVARLTNNKLVNKDLEIFTVPVATVPQNLPEFNVPAGQLQAMWQNYQKIETILKPLGLHVVYFELSLRQSWQLKLNNGLKIILGHTNGLDHLSRFAEVYNQVITAQNLGMIEYIDLRYPNGMAVHPQKGR